METEAHLNTSSSVRSPRLLTRAKERGEACPVHFTSLTSSREMQAQSKRALDAMATMNEPGRRVKQKI